MTIKVYEATVFKNNLAAQVVVNGYAVSEIVIDLTTEQTLHQSTYPRDYLPYSLYSDPTDFERYTYELLDSVSRNEKQPTFINAMEHMH